MSREKFKRISIEEAQEHYYLKPHDVSCTIANAYTLTPVADQDGWEEINYWIKKISFNAKYGTSSFVYRILPVSIIFLKYSGYKGPAHSMVAFM